MIDKVTFKKFREAENLELRIGKNLTVIAGQNGTMKSTLLACLAQPFGIERGKENDIFDDEKLENCKIITKTFKTKIGDIFKLSEKYDIPGCHEFEVHFTDELSQDLIYENPLRVKSFKVDRNPPIRFVTGKDRRSGKGNIPIPVVYMGLARIYPLGESEVLQEKIELTVQEKEFLYKNYQNILLSYNEKYEEVNQISKNKRINTIGISTDKYDWKTISAGQDNIGKIISTILEFKRMKDTFKKNYYGGIILIDELETTLYPRAQKELLKFLNKECQKLKLKIIFTTHSIEILKECVENEAISRNVQINFLDKTRGKLINKNIATFNDIVKNLLVLPKENYNKNIPKINVYIEDKEGEWLLGKILDSKVKKYIEFKPLYLGHAEISKLGSRIDEIKEGIIVYDADVKSILEASGEKSELRKSMNKSDSNSLTLPGEKSIEEDLINILKEIPEDKDEFWEKCINDNKQVAISKLNEYDINTRNSRKAWFKAEIKNYGPNGRELYNLWKLKNKHDVENFSIKFKEMIVKKYLSRYGINIEL